MDWSNVNVMVPTLKVKGKQVVTPLKQQHSYSQILIQYGSDTRYVAFAFYARSRLPLYTFSSVA